MAWWRIVFYSYIAFSARSHLEYWKWGFIEKHITFGQFYQWDGLIVQSRVLLGLASTDFATSDFSKLMPFLFIFQSLFFSFTVKCPCEESKVQVKPYLWTLNCKRDRGTLCNMQTPNYTFVSVLSPCFQGIFMCIILLDLHNNPLI